MIENVGQNELVKEKLKNLQTITIKLIRELTLTEKSKKNNSEIKLRNLADINSYLKQIYQLSPSALEAFADQKLIIYVRYFLIETSSKISPLDFFKTIMVSEHIIDRFLHHNIPLYIARVIEKDDQTKLKPNTASITSEEEVISALKFIGQWLERFPKRFPQYFAACLMALTDLPVLTNFEEKKKDHISQYVKTIVVDIFLLMSSKNTELCCICGGFTFLVNSIIDPNLQEKSYQILTKMLFFINDPLNRIKTSEYLDFRKIFHCLVDLDNIFLEEGYKMRSNFEMLGKFQSKLSLAKNAIITLFKSWAGIIYLGNHPHTVSAMLEALKQIPRKSDSEIRTVIFEILDEILSVSDYVLAASASDEKGIFRMNNLLGCYLMTVVELLVDQELLKLLIEFSGMEETIISEPAQKLLKKLTLLIFSFRPESSKYIDFLITSATGGERKNSQTIKSSSSFMINKIGNFIYDRKEKKNHPMFNELENLFSLKTIFVPYLRASVNSISKSLNFINYREKEGYRKNLLESNPIPKEHKENYLKWDWETVENLLAFPDPEKFKSSANERYRENKLYKYLLRFYSPSRGNFKSLSWTMENFLYIKCGRLMVKNSITIPENLPLVKNPPQSQFECTVSFIGDLEKYLEISIAECLKEDCNNPTLKLETTLQHSLLSFIGYFSENKVGYETLLCENRFFELLYGCIQRQECSHLIFLILISLDFYREDVKKTVNQSSYMIGPKALLEKCIKEGSKSIRLASLEMIKILLKSELLQFSIYSYKILIYLLWKEEAKSEMVHLITQFLEQHLSSKATIEVFIHIFVESLTDFDNSIVKGDSMSSEHSGRQHKGSEDRIEESQQIVKHIVSQANQVMKFRFGEIKEKLTTPIITRFLSNKIGLEVVKRYYPDWLQAEFEKWLAPNHNYCTVLESKMNKTLNFSKKSNASFYRITGNSNMNVYDLLFMYKLPWILYLNDQKYPLWIRQLDHHYQLYLDLSIPELQPCLVSKSSDSVKIMLGIGSMLVDEEFQLVADEENKSQLSIFLSMHSRQIKLYGEEVTKAESHGVQIYYRKWEPPSLKQKSNMEEKNMTDQEKWEDYSRKVSDMNKLEIQRVVINIWVPSTEHLKELPLHLINQLNKTDEGRHFIKEKGYIQRCQKVLQEFRDADTAVKKNLVEVRSTLWSLGFFGSTNEGIKILNESGVYQIIVKMAMDCPTLSIRGTCRYVLNMFTHSERGRSLLIGDHFQINGKSFNCYPEKISQFCKISDPPSYKYLRSKQYWQQYAALHRPLNKNEEKFLEQVSLLLNSLSFKNAATQIRDLLKASPKMVHSTNLLQNVVNLLTFFKYKHESRKSIMNMFDELIRSGDFNSEKGGKIQYFLPGTCTMI